MPTDYFLPATLVFRFFFTCRNIKQQAKAGPSTNMRNFLGYLE